MTEDEWQAHVTREAAQSVGAWLEARGRLHQPIRSLTALDLEAVADAAIGRFIALTSERMRTQPAESGGLTRLLLG